MQKSIAPSTRKWVKVSPIVCLVLPANHYCAHDSYEQHQTSNFKWKDVAITGGAVQELADVYDVVWWERASGSGAVGRSTATIPGGVLPHPASKNNHPPH